MRSQIFWEIIGSQTTLLVAGFSVLLALTFIVPHLAENRELLLMGFGMAIGTMPIPTWYFQGIEDLEPISAFVFSWVARSAFRRCICSCVIARTSISRWPSNALVPLVSGIAICTYLYFRRELDFVPPSFKTIGRRRKEGWSVFMATSLVDAYASSNIVAISFF